MSKSYSSLYNQYTQARDAKNGPLAGRAIGLWDRHMLNRRHKGNAHRRWTAWSLPGFREAYNKARSGRGERKKYDLIVVVPGTFQSIWAYPPGSESGSIIGRLDGTDPEKFPSPAVSIRRDWLLKKHWAGTLTFPSLAAFNRWRKSRQAAA